jgi:hypothetical protein
LKPLLSVYLYVWIPSRVPFCVMLITQSFKYQKHCVKTEKSRNFSNTAEINGNFACVMYWVLLLVSRVLVHCIQVPRRMCVRVFLHQTARLLWRWRKLLQKGASTLRLPGFQNSFFSHIDILVYPLQTFQEHRIAINLLSLSFVCVWARARKERNIYITRTSDKLWQVLWTSYSANSLSHVNLLLIAFSS